MTKTIEQLIEESKQLDAERENKKPKRKTPTKEEKLQKEINQMLDYDDIVAKKQEESKVVKKKSEDEWDVKIGEEITYFDPTLSYELTGYRPITKDKGLDFDPKVFTEAADHFKEFKRYTNYPVDTFSWREHWLEEARRCREGYTVGKYTLTGENYFFLNYYRLKNPKAGNIYERRKESFPEFINKQYEYFHYLELCRRTDHDGIVFKSRGVNGAPSR